MEIADRDVNNKIFRCDILGDTIPFFRLEILSVMMGMIRRKKSQSEKVFKTTYRLGCISLHIDEEFLDIAADLPIVNQIKSRISNHRKVRRIVNTKSRLGPVRTRLVQTEVPNPYTIS